MGTSSKVSVIIVTWNSERFIADCLESLVAQTHPPIETIVVDNGSSDRTLDIARSFEPRLAGLQIVALGGNTGYCRANNAGIERSTGNRIFFLNADVILDPGYIRSAVSPFAKDERIGSVAGKLLRFDRKTLDTAGQSLSRGRWVIERGYDRRDDGGCDAAGFVFSVCTAAAIYRRSAIDDISMAGEFFDTDHFSFYEDIDAGWRARNAGWRAYYEPAAVGYHYRGGSAGRGGFFASRAAILKRPVEFRYHHLKNRYLMMLKNDRLSDLVRDLPFVLPRELSCLALAAASGPGFLMRVLSLAFGADSPFAKARAKRREFLARRGVWGERRAGLPSQWTGEWIEPAEFAASANLASRAASRVDKETR